MANHEIAEGAPSLGDIANELTQDLSPILAPLMAYFDTIWSTLAPQFASSAGLVQLCLIGAGGVLAFLFGGLLRRLIARLFKTTEDMELSRMVRMLLSLAPPLVWVATLWVGVVTLGHLGYPNDLARLAASLLNAWIVIRLVSSLVADPFWSRLFALCAWIVAALNALRLLEPTIALLERAAFTVGDVRISLYLAIKAVALIIILLWLAGTLSRLINQRVSRSQRLTPSVQTLINQGVRLGFTLVAVLMALNAVGVDLTAFAVFSGAIGVGLGFGLQKIVSNFVSGIIILSDRSIKPGDVVEVADTYGWVTSLGARYASIRTRDGTEHLIPNEEFITGRVINWTHSDTAVRRKLPIGVAYGTDLDMVIPLIKAAVEKTGRVLSTPPVNVLVVGFGDSSIDLEARFWIADPQNGVTNVKSEAILHVWRAFRDHGVEIPFPQRDLHIRSGLPAHEAGEPKGENGAQGRGEGAGA